MSVFRLFFCFFYVGCYASSREYKIKRLIHNAHILLLNSNLSKTYLVCLMYLYVNVHRVEEKDMYLLRFQCKNCHGHYSVRTLPAFFSIIRKRKKDLTNQMLYEIIVFFFIFPFHYCFNTED
jgi:transposase-like protein